LRGIENSDAEYGLVPQNQGPAFASASVYAALRRDLPSSDYGMASMTAGQAPTVAEPRFDIKLNDQCIIGVYTRIIRWNR
jgi:hypothetical protein